MSCASLQGREPKTESGCLTLLVPEGPQRYGVAGVLGLRGLITGWPAIRLYAGCTTSPHALNEAPEEVLWQCLPLLLQCICQVLQILRLHRACCNTQLQHVPYMLDRVEVGRHGWPPEGLNIVLLQMLRHNSGAVWTSIVILKDESWPML